MRQERELPLVDLYSDDKPESQKAREFLDGNGIRFSDWVSGQDYVPEPGFVPPVLHAREGEFVGLKGVKTYVEVFADR